MDPIVAKSYYAGEVSDLKIRRMNERDLQAELFHGKKAEDIVDAFEESQGRKPKREVKTNIRHKIRAFDISIPEDLELFEELMNNPKFIIGRYESTFTVGGQHRIVCVYSEDLDYDKNNKKREDKQNE